MLINLKSINIILNGLSHRTHSLVNIHWGKTDIFVHFSETIMII